MTRQVVLDTETTGLEPAKGHRIIEIGCVEIIDRRITKNTLQFYINPERDIDVGAVKVHGITSEFLQDKPVFKDVVIPFLEFIKDSELIIHNAPFDIGFLDHELARYNKHLGKIAHYAKITDTLTMARQKHPGQKNSLDALCKRYNISNEHRAYHGALLDAQILADVYLAMTRGQSSLIAEAVELAPSHHGQGHTHASTAQKATEASRDYHVVQASAEEQAAHANMLAHIQKQSQHCVWLDDE